MPHPKDSEIYPIGTKVAIIRGVNFGRTAIIKHHDFQFDGKNFLNYRGEIDGRDGLYAIYHEDLEIIETPTAQSDQ